MGISVTFEKVLFLEQEGGSDLNNETNQPGMRQQKAPVYFGVENLATKKRYLKSER